MIALSQDSTESPYVTYEWAYAIGKGKTVIPIKISQCKMHPRLETIQYLDFTVPSALPWDLLIGRIREIEVDNEQNQIVLPTTLDDTNVKAILNYLNQRGYQMASFDRVRRRIDPELSDEKLTALIENNKTIFKQARLKGRKDGIAKIVP